MLEDYLLRIDLCLCHILDVRSNRQIIHGILDVGILLMAHIQLLSLKLLGLAWLLLIEIYLLLHVLSNILAWWDRWLRPLLFWTIVIIILRHLQIIRILLLFLINNRFTIITYKLLLVNELLHIMGRLIDTITNCCGTLDRKIRSYSIGHHNSIWWDLFPS